MAMVFEINVEQFAAQVKAINKNLTNDTLARLRTTFRLLRETGWYVQNNMRDDWHPDPDNPNESAEDYWCDWKKGSHVFQATLIIAYTDWIGGLSMDDILYDHELPTIKRAQALAIEDWFQTVKPLWGGKSP